MKNDNDEIVYEDFAKYPRSIDSDRQIAEQAGARVIFHPNMSVIYPRKYGISLSLPDVASRWESDFRPTHFAGVMGVCLRLFNLVTPDAVFFGQKDLQQLRVIETMVQDLRLGIRVVPIRTVRDKDGLAMSSRNAYLSPEQRTLALVIREALTLGRAKIIEGNNSVQEIESAMCEIILAKNGLTIDYLNIVHSQTLEPAITLRGELAIIAAVRVGGTRLIDNEILTV